MYVNIICCTHFTTDLEWTKKKNTYICIFICLLYISTREGSIGLGTTSH